MKNFKNTGDRDSKRSDSKFGGERRGSSDGRRDSKRSDSKFGGERRGSSDGRRDSGRREGGFGGSRNRSRGGSRDGGFGGRRDSGFGGEKVMHRATCAECGNSCEVPFKPTGEKPVYCSTCFANRVV